MMDAERHGKEEVGDIFKAFSAFVFGRKSFAHIKELCLQGQAGALRIRTFCWRVFLIVIFLCYSCSSASSQATTTEGHGSKIFAGLVKSSSSIGKASMPSRRQTWTRTYTTR